MIRRFIAASCLLTATLHAVPVFIGTSTGGSSTSKGIYLADFDPATGKLTEPVLAAEYQNPGFLALHPGKPVLYACGVSAAAAGGGSSTVAAFAIGTNHGLKALGEATSGGKGACHVAVDATGRTVAVANYSDGSFWTARLDEDGVPGVVASVVFHKGSGPSKPRQDGPHPHGVYFDPANQHLLVPDLGLDRVAVYPFDAATSKLGEPLPSLATAPGAGPRHLVFSPDGKHAYIINELDNSLLATAVEAGKFTPLACVPTLPPDFTAFSKAAEIEVSPDGRFVYASNRGHESIVVFRRDGQTGALTYLQHAPCGGKHPRHFKIDPSGKWLLCAHMDSNTISVLPLDPASGLLGKPEHTVAAPSPTCLLFAR